MAHLDDVFALDEIDDQNLPSISDSGVPFISFYHSQQGRASDVADAIDGVATIGMPWVSVDGTYYRADTAPWLMLGKPLYYWCTVTDDNEKEKVWLTPQPTFLGKKRNLVDGLKVQESVLAMALVLGVGPQAGVSVMVDIIKGTQSKAFKMHYDEVRNSTKTEHAARYGALVGELKPFQRVTSKFKVTEKPGSKFPYALITARSGPISTQEMEKLLAWGQDADSQDQFARVRSEFARRRAVIESLAE